MPDKVAPEKTVRYANKPMKHWFNKYMRDERKISKTEIMFGESTDNNINGRLTQKRETYATVRLSTTRNK